MKIQLHALAARHPAARPGTPPALQPLDLQVAASEHLAVIGPSGAGKTTLLQALACALRPASGRLTLDGVDPWTLTRSELQRLRGRLFLAPQAPPLPPRQRVVTSVLAGRLPAMSLAASLRSLFYPNDIPAAYEALARFDLGDKLFERVDRLSGGERQRVGLARALLAPATLWLVDEPLSALDPARAALAHFPRIVGLRDGRLAFDLPASEVTPERLAQLYAQHEHELRSSAPVADALPPDDGPPPAVMHCR